jgi:hypothetical protein
VRKWLQSPAGSLVIFGFLLIALLTLGLTENYQLPSFLAVVLLSVMLPARRDAFYKLVVTALVAYFGYGVWSQLMSTGISPHSFDSALSVKISIFVFFILQALKILKAHIQQKS